LPNAYDTGSGADVIFGTGIDHVPMMRPFYLWPEGVSNKADHGSLPGILDKQAPAT